MVLMKEPSEEEVVVEVVEQRVIPAHGTVEYIDYVSELDGHLPSPINVSIAGAIKYPCPELKWYNFDVYAHKIQLYNTGYAVHMGAKWKTERPYLEGGPLLQEHVFSQAHFHWGANMTHGSEHEIDRRKYPGEVQLTFFKKEYMTQKEALKHPDGCMIVCYMIKHGVLPDERINKFIQAFPRIQEAQTKTRIGPYPLSQLFPMFYEDYFLYWGTLETVKGNVYTVRWLIPRVSLHATMEQMNEFRKLWDPWDEPNLGHCRVLQEKGDRRVFFISPHWNQYNSLLPTPRIPETSISVLSPEYLAKPWMLPPQNAYMLHKEEENPNEKKDKNKNSEDNNS